MALHHGLPALQTALTVAVTGSGNYPVTGASPELAVMLACVGALPDGPYVLLDSADPEGATPEGEEVTRAVLSHSAVTVAQWSGDLPGSTGYGSVERVATSRGTVLIISLGGSSHASATNLWVVPLVFVTKHAPAE